MPESGAQAVLIVEDDAPLRSIIARKLVDIGYQVLEVADGVEGLELALRKHPDIILLDILMPHDGIDMLAKLRAAGGYGRHVPAIFLTNMSPDSERVIKAIEAYEPAFFLVKADLSPAQVVEKIKEALRKR